MQVVLMNLSAQYFYMSLMEVPLIDDERCSLEGTASPQGALARRPSGTTTSIPKISSDRGTYRSLGRAWTGPCLPGLREASA